MGTTWYLSSNIVYILSRFAYLWDTGTKWSTAFSIIFTINPVPGWKGVFFKFTLTVTICRRSILQPFIICSISCQRRNTIPYSLKNNLTVVHVQVDGSPSNKIPWFLNFSKSSIFFFYFFSEYFVNVVSSLACWMLIPDVRFKHQ